MGKVLAILLAVVLLVAGGFLALAGMGYIGAHADTSRTWTVGGSVLAGLGVALLITLLQRRH